MEMTISKPPIRKGLSYVLKTSWLQQIMEENGLNCHVDLNYWVPQSGGSILEAEYWLPNANIPYPRVYVRAGALPSDQRRVAADSMLNTVLPAYAKWLGAVLKLPRNSPALHAKPWFCATFDAGNVQVRQQLQN